MSIDIAKVVGREIAVSGTPIKISGNATDYVLATITIPGGSLSPDSLLELKSLFTFSGSAGGRKVNLFWGGTNIIGQSFPTATIGAIQVDHLMWVAPDLQSLTVFIQNFNDVTSPSANGQGAPYSVHTSGTTVLSVDLTQDQTFTLSTKPAADDTAELTGFSLMNYSLGASKNFAIGTSIACWGDSLTAGTGSASPLGGWPSQLLIGVPGRPVANLGVGGQTSSQVVDRLVRDKVRGKFWTQVLWVGRNDVGNADLTNVVLTQLARAVANMDNGGKYLIGTITPANGETSGTANGIAIAAANAAIKAAYPAANIVDLFTILTAGTSDGTIQSSWMQNATAGNPHLNDLGYTQVYNAISAKLTANGW